MSESHHPKLYRSSGNERAPDLDQLQFNQFGENAEPYGL